MCAIVEKLCGNYFARSNGTIRSQTGEIMIPSKTAYGHLCFWRNNRSVYLHRLIALAFVHNPIPSVFTQVDHVDGDPSNNIPTNLRWLTKQLNSMNQKKAVHAYYNKRIKKWRSSVIIRGTFYSLGYFTTKEAASQKAKIYKQKQFDRIYQNHIEEAKKNGTYVPFPYYLINETSRARSYLFGF